MLLSNTSKLGYVVYSARILEYSPTVSFYKFCRLYGGGVQGGVLVRGVHGSRLVI